MNDTLWLVWFISTAVVVTSLITFAMLSAAEVLPRRQAATARQGRTAQRHRHRLHLPFTAHHA
ncbi:hypothetical protein [Nocardioides sp. GXZ039]|uniref:hypothetical protein n=1 Tax=Nocardioides sp. GXZ039 TaxID=3136018 RepID=UPI0030F459E1